MEAILQQHSRENISPSANLIQDKTLIGEKNVGSSCEVFHKCRLKEKHDPQDVREQQRYENI